MLVALPIERILFVLAMDRMLALLPRLPMLENGLEVELEVEVVLLALVCTGLPVVEEATEGGAVVKGLLSTGESGFHSVGEGEP